MWEDLDHGSIIKKGIFYFSNNKLCFNSLILNFPVRKITKYTTDLENNYYELGTDILNERSDEEIQKMVQNKIILIGDFVDRDIHATSFGDIPGVLINYNAYLALKSEGHIIPVSLLIILIRIRKIE